MIVSQSHSESEEVDIMRAVPPLVPNALPMRASGGGLAPPPPPSSNPTDGKRVQVTLLTTPL